MKIEYQDLDADYVMAYFAKGFKCKLSRHEWFYDAKKNRVIFKLYVLEEKDMANDSKK